MRRFQRSVLFAFVLLCSASSASAQGWGRDWFERLSGPGPFKGFGLQFPVGCRWNTAGSQKFYWYFQTPEGMSQPRGDRPNQGSIGDESSTRTLCIDSQYSSTSNSSDDSENVGLFEVRTVEGRVGFPLESRRYPYWLSAFEPSVAAGAIRFQSAGFSEWRFTISPEITLKPLKFIRPSSGKVGRPNKRGDWRGVLEFAYGAVLISPKIDNEDLRVPQLEPFEHGWLRRATFVRINATELVGLR